MARAGGKPLWVVLAVCLLAAMLEGFDIQSMGVAAPRMVPALGLTPGQAGWAFSASLIGLMIGASTGGVIADRIGRRPVLVASAVAFGLFSLATPLAGDFEILLLVRILTGLGLGGAFPMLVALASEQAGPSHKATLVAVVTAGMPLGGALAGLVARSPLGQDWRMIFVLGGIAPLLVAPLLYGVLPLGKPAAIARQGRATLAALFAPGRLTVSLSLWIGCALAALTLHLLLNWLPILLVARGLPKSAAFGALALFNLGGAAGGVAVGALADRFGPRWPLVGSFAGLALALLGLAAAGGGGQIALLALVAGFLLLGGQFTLYGLAPQLYDDAVRGTGVGAAIAASRLGSIFGPLAAAELIGGGAATGASIGTVVGALVPVALLTGLSAAILVSTRNRMGEGDV